jgi:gamma-glutamylcyclotransferase (GGCT)/AIG2-like uncharacterized protein YtfP
MTIRSIVRQALSITATLTNRELRDIVARSLDRKITYNLSGTMVKQERERLHKNENSILLFVYGTLMRGFGNNVYTLSGATFVKCEAITGFDMYTNGAYPMLVDSDDPTKTVHGEIFLISKSTFAKCDSLEGYPTHYNRKQVQTTQGLAWVYFYEKTGFNTRLDRLIPIENGDFREYKRNKMSFISL